MSDHSCIRQPRLFFFLASLICIAACHFREKSRELVEVQVHYVGFDPVASAPVVILQEKNGEKTMPIWIGMAEAQAIALQLQGATPARPLTHDLLKTILDQAGVEFDHALVSSVKDGAYYARIHLMNGRKALEVDSRPSDAIALAMRFHRPIFVARELFEAAPSSIIIAEHEAAARKPAPQVSTKLFGVTMQDLTSSLAEHFGLPDANGVLVTDVAGMNGGTHLQRGDVIVAANGEMVRGVEDLQHKLHDEQGQVASLRVRRDGEETEVSLILAADESSQTKEEAK
jgi:bifunctional DNase/RNase